MTPTPNYSPELVDSEFTAGLHRIIDEDPSASRLVLVASNGILLKDDVLVQNIAGKVLEFEARHAAEDPKTEDEIILRQAIEQRIIGTPGSVRMREVDDLWGFYFSAFRSLRPYREGGKQVTSIRKPFDPNGFNFDRISDECFWRGRIGNVDTRVYYNKFPYTAKHTILVPDQDSRLPQYLEHKYHNFAWEVAASSSRGTSIGYNSLGAYASVNQLHFHMISGNSKGLPVENPRVEGQKYPAYKLEFDNSSDAWQYIEALHIQNQPYNIIYLPGRVMVFPRKFQNTYAQPDWSTGFAWFELGGNFVVKTAEGLLKVSAQVIRLAYDEMKAIPDLRVA